MAKTYTDADQATIDLWENVKEAFPDLAEAKVKIVFRDKREGGDESIKFADIRKFSDLVKHITLDIPDLGGEPLHYCIVIDENIWNALDEDDKYRILFHEALHAKVDYKETGEVQYNIRKHTVETFYEEIDREAKAGGDPRWKERCATVAVSIYDEIKEREKAEKKGKKKGKF